MILAAIGYDILSSLAVFFGCCGVACCGVVALWRRGLAEPSQELARGPTIYRRMDADKITDRH
jgi:hypothetical protein